MIFKKWLVENENSSNLPSVKIIKTIAPAICDAAQKVYDQWNVEEFDEYAGGGICHVIAEEIVSVLDKHNVACVTFSHDMGEVHVSVIAQFKEGVYDVDISPYIYERGGGYTWKKIDDVHFEPSDISINRIYTDPSEFKNYVED